MHRVLFFIMVLTLVFSVSSITLADTVFTTVTPISPISGNPIATNFYPSNNYNQCYCQVPPPNPYYNQYPSPNCYNNYNYRNPYVYMNPYCTPYSVSDANGNVKTQIVRNIGQNLIYSLLNK